MKMDPNEALKQLRELSGRLDQLDLDDFRQKEEFINTADEMSTVFDGLDQWIVNGGFLPTDWSKK